ncbi:antibiotic biosynthesis monooxygenase family protein [Burkholderia stabilis]|uniref:antibiotic biosynthesis monooxygenase family protein n=1 Tax=Burkholderia stabilis TaxID=95485 RepID=UPI0015918F1F|nr:antibiotic biosynthesis monooxygenase [Burkholderia stabilis]
MYIAVNRFKVKLGSEAAFEHIWSTRETYLRELPGAIEFNLLKGGSREDHILYSSQTIWTDYVAFESWRNSKAFDATHRGESNDSRALFLGHPEFEGFEVVQSIK